ncbi:MAG: sigma-70 family RNA polymerase sigma factor [Actinomycetota bacterium]|nr:sigma-70 family RNA polymerase sigma factor [Actinomycetota bacterium]
MNRSAGQLAAPERTRERMAGPERVGERPATPGELVRRAAGSDESAWRALVQRFSGLVWSITRAQGLSSTDGADVSQTVWLRLVDNLDRLREPERVGAWLATTTRHECIRVSRLRQRSVPVGEPEVFDIVDPVAEQDPAATLVKRGRDSALREVVATMPERSQALLHMLMADPPLSYEEVAAGLGIPVGSIGPTRQRCLGTLRAKCVGAGIVL